MNQTKPFLFYSNYCEHSKRIIDRIQPTLLVNQLNLICIDNPKINIPDFIQVVPTLFEPNQRSVIINQDLFNWVESQLGGGAQPQMAQPQMGQPQMGQPQMAQPQMAQQPVSQPQVSMNNERLAMREVTGDDSILAFQKNEMLGSAGSAYSFIEDNDNETLNGNFSYLDERDVNSMPKFTKANQATEYLDNNDRSGKSKSNSGKGSAITSAYDKMLADRQKENANSITQMRI